MARVPRHRHRQLPRRVTQGIQSDLRVNPQVNSGPGVYKRNENDSRHSCLSLMWYGQTKIRALSDWAMGYAGPRETGRYTKDMFTSLNDLNSDEAMFSNLKIRR
jgi:hypothetical protein